MGALYRRFRMAQKTKKRESEANTQVEDKKSAETKLDVEAMSVDELKAKLNELEIKFSHNTGEEKLREKLKEALENESK